MPVSNYIRKGGRNLPKFNEVYGSTVINESSAESNKNLPKTHCPFTKSRCDGGGNRHQTTIDLKKVDMKGYFDESIDKVIPGICSIEHGPDKWVVCPRRLLGFDPKSKAIPEINESLTAHERAGLIAAGLPKGVELGVWPEVYLKEETEDASINYHFDFVIAPLLKEVLVSDVSTMFGLNQAQTLELMTASKKGGYLQKNNGVQLFSYAPDLSFPFIIEVMTASTSGSDKTKETDIPSAFINYVKNLTHTCPGINKRQVWGRMATQLFSKSALAHEWGGKTIWLVQDTLLNNIENTTKLNLRTGKSATDSNSINFLSMKFGENSNDVVFDKYVEQHSGLDFEGSQRSTDILLAKVAPPKSALLTAIQRRKLSARLVL